MTPSSTQEAPCPLPSPDSSKSFWLSEPILLGHRTTEELPAEADVVVVGTGITGASALRYLAESGMKLRIVALDAREVCSGATGRNGGHLQPLPYARSPSIGAFEIEGSNELASYIHDNSVPCEYRALDAVRSFWTQESVAQILPRVHQLKKEDPKVGAKIEVVTDDAGLAALGLQKGCAGALVNKAAATLWPYKAVTHMVQSLVESKSINLQTNTPVDRISRNGGKWSVQTRRGSIMATNVILATNAYTSHLLHDFSPLIVPARGHVTALIPPQQEQSPPETLSHSYGLIAHSPNAGKDVDEDDYLIQRPYAPGPNRKMHLIFGGAHYDSKLTNIGPDAADDSVVDPDAVAYLRKSILKAIKVPGDTQGFDELETEYSWSGIQGYSRDNRPWVGEVPGEKGLFVAAGYSGHGLPNGPLCAKAVVKMILENKTGQEVVKEGASPEEYLLTEERIKNAMRMPSVVGDDYQGELLNNVD
ncbi:FAD dependent oxidoreductase [Lophiotrema nucula]|uniref:FAD dependent oxidoreductase n=1 Tax=Lophiotrema nucula TaxID=690887 RepID=A0A6A5ZGJ7_9PLEO|nr:FAD dependent oxidoreductase [Lophiotrema nucula]